MASRFHQLFLFCILCIALVLVPAATETFQEPQGMTNCGETTCAKGDGVCYKSCIEEGFNRGGDCLFHNNHEDKICCCYKNESSLSPNYYLN
ncbi:Nodule Cysteine-Rich (NCR) secreted peptide [Medicago truncatula]|uniref:Nodule Cysteine-Rich (NCR) secreted peptide n=1 Tax=Medicago truncatula TaxID=3880 RepID=A0A072TYB9_MEDTR|nr:Nodule Cysteine-Rich (NCR) secreted peptide [Medicago truncatula]